MINPDRYLAGALASIHYQFRPDELAYLAATTKVEGPFRDRLAFRIYEDHVGTGTIVAREWSHPLQRVDIAILDREQVPLVLIELKALYAYDAVLKPGEYAAKTLADERKAHLVSVDATAVYSLMLVTHLHGEVKGFTSRTVKYMDRINLEVRRRGGADKVRSLAIQALDAELTGRNVVARGEVPGGSAFGRNVSVLYWLVRNDRPAAL